MTFGILVSLILYLRGWLILHRTLPARFPTWRLYAFVSGLATLWLAIASPLDAFSGLLLSAHMVQHLMLMSVSPPLILLGAPMLPLLRGLPRTFAHDGVGPFLNWPALRRLGNSITHPLTCWILMAVTLFAWHTPAAFDLALGSPGWHKIEHACFLGAALLFWWPVIRPFPIQAKWPLWIVPIYLLAGDLLNTVLSAFLTFSDHVFYRPYLTVPRLFGTTALSDQTCAGVIMWVPGSIVFLIPAALIAIHCLSASPSLVRPQKNAPVPVAPPRPILTRKPFDLLFVPIIGPFLRSQAGRRLLQAVLFIIALDVILDGVLGTKVSSMNLAGVLPWTYWRALTVIALLAAGNFFCMACPFMFFRELGKRLGLPQRPWPQALRSKWVSVAVLALFFWAYEVFGLWDKPIWTAWLIINYFLVAFAVDAVFRGASFCKYLCPIGQFQFVASLVSPLEVKIRQPTVCASCKTHDCLRGNEQQRGCEMELHLPRKSGNMDCTFCLDCVRACPHDNIGLMAVAPGMDIVRDPLRSSVGRFAQRPDIAALAFVFVFAAFANAALMTAPVAAWRDTVAARLGLNSFQATTAILLLFALVSTAVALLASSASGPRNGLNMPVRERFARFSISLVPIGVSMWAGHFLYHLNAGWLSVAAPLSRIANDSRWHLFRFQNDGTAAPLLSADTMLVFQTLLLDAGLLLTLYLGWRIARIHAPRLRSAFWLLAPWAVMAAALYAAGVWLFLQPMEMRGMPNLAALM